MHLLTFPDVLQSQTRTAYLERLNGYQSTELMKMQKEVYHLRSVLSSQGVDSAVDALPVNMLPFVCVEPLQCYMIYITQT